MAPDSKLYRHRLGVPKKPFWRGLAKVALLFCFAFCLPSNGVSARMEPERGLWQVFRAGFSPNEWVNHSSFYSFPSFTFSPNSSKKPPVVQKWSNRIQIPIPNHSAIQRYVRYYEGEGRLTFVTSFERSLPYLPIMTEILNSHGVPGELIAVAMIESRFRPRASYRGAIGFWQFMAPTARSLGLRVDQWVDERNDPIKSTDAAARYLKQLHEQFGSWPLALAAYNAGGATVSNALRRENATTFWEIGKQGVLPGITRRYVPKVLATASILGKLEEHGFENPQNFPEYDTEPVAVRGPLRLDQVARWVDMPLSDLRDLNPTLRRDRLPPDCRVDLHLPSGTRKKFELAYSRFTRK